jgi:hypothetical protein
MRNEVVFMRRPAMPDESGRALFAFGHGLAGDTRLQLA